jgi:hypothetical protein
VAKPVKHYGKFRIRVIDASGKRQSAVFDTYREADKWGKLMEADVVRVRHRSRPTSRPAVQHRPTDGTSAQRLAAHRDRR